MGDGVRKESNDSQGVMNAKLCLSATDKSEVWGRGLGRRAVWLGLTTVIL